MSTIVIMPGGFHPFHAGHMALYNSARQAFPNADLYVAATNSQEERPFPFSVKEKLAKVAGVEPGHFVQVKSPFQAKEITQHYNPDEDQLIFVRSEKDRDESPKPGGMKKDGSPAYFQPFTGKGMQPFGKHAYFAYLPTVKFGGGLKSASEIRAEWPTLDEQGKLNRVMSLYPASQKNPKLAANIVGMLDQVMGGQVDEDLSRRGFLKGLGAAAVAGATGSAMAQSQPVDASRAFANMHKDDPIVQHNKDIDEMARAIYDQIITQRGQPMDRRQQEMWMTIAREKASEKLAKYAPGRPATQPQRSGFPSQGSERRVSRNIDNFESVEQGVAEGSLNEFAVDGFGDNGDKRSKLLASVGRLLDSGNKVDWQVPGQMGHVTKVQDDGITMKKWKTPHSRMAFFLPMYDDSRDSKYTIKMVAPKHYAVISAEQGVAEDKESDPVTNAVLSFYKPVINDIHKEKLPDYVDQARHLLQQTNDPKVRSKLIDIFKKGKENPYIQGGIVTTVGALLAGGVLSTANSMGLSPAQTNLALQAILNTVIPTVVSRINGKNWTDTIKYTLASAGVGTGIASAGLIEDDLEEGSEEALQYAIQAHAGQTRSGGDPYITHPIRVADHIKQYKQSHNLDALISAAYLHDTVEDTDTTHEALHDLFGGLVASLVKELTSDPEEIKRVGKAQYLAHKMAAMSSYALVIKLADRLDNVKDITTARTPQWRAKYAAETNQILNYIEKTRALSGTHQKLIGLIRAKLSELDNPQPEVNEVLNTKPNKINKSTWSEQTEDLVKLNFVASNGIPYDLSITALYMSPDEIQDSVPEEIPDEIRERGRFVEFIQEVKPGDGYGKQGIEGTGAAAEVLAIVYNALNQYIRKYKPTFLMFQAAEPSRRRLYSTLVKKMLQTMPNWKYTENDGIFFVYDTRYIKQGMEEGFGIPMPGTYEQEHDMYQKQSGHHTHDLTSESNLSESTDYLEEK